jgi:hypothetical protein
MTTTTIEQSKSVEPRVTRTRVKVRVGRIGIGAVAVVALLVSAWGAAVPYISPLFGYDGTGGTAWKWNLGHALLGLAPGAVGVSVALLVLAETRGITVGRGRLGLSAAGFVLMLCGAWFVLGPSVWPVITNQSGYLAAASPLRSFTYELGYSLGTGAVLMALGGFIAGWAARHGAPVAVANETTQAVNPELV